MCDRVRHLPREAAPGSTEKLSIAHAEADDARRRLRAAGIWRRKQQLPWRGRTLPQHAAAYLPTHLRRTMSHLGRPDARPGSVGHEPDGGPWWYFTTGTRSRHHPKDAS